MKCIAAGEIAVNPTIDFYYVDKEVEASEMSALECVLSVDKEKERLEEEAEYLQDHADTPEGLPCGRCDTILSVSPPRA